MRGQMFSGQTLFRGLLCAVFLASAAASAADYPSAIESLPPLARVQVKLTETEQLRLYNLLTDFSNRGHFVFEGGAFTRGARPFHLVTIHVDKDTDIQVTNFRLPAVFELNVYSRANEESWRPYWSELVSELSASFGFGRVSTVT